METENNDPRPVGAETEKREPEESNQAVCSLLCALINLGDTESKSGLFRISLDYDNCHDGARILNGDGEVIAECYDNPPPQISEEKTVEWQFIQAIQRAKHKAEN